MKGSKENAVSGEQLDSVRKETHVVSVMIEHLETDATSGRRTIVFSCTNRADTDRRKETIERLRLQWRKSFWNMKPNCVPTLPQEKVHEPVMRSSAPSRLSEQDSKNAKKTTDIDTLRLMGGPVKSQRKGSDALLKESIQFGCVSQNSHPSKSILRKAENFGPNHTVKFSKGTKNRERKCPSRGVIQKCEPHERNPCAPTFD